MTGRPSALRTTVLAVAVLLSACQHAAPTLPPLPPQQVETGSTFTLLTPLAFPAGRPELLFQNQRLLSAEGLSRMVPYCRLVPQVGAPHTLVPTTFKVANVFYDERESGSTSAMFSITRITLATATNPAGYTLSCGWPEATSATAFVTTEQIYNAIGGQFTMQLAR